MILTFPVSFISFSNSLMSKFYFPSLKSMAQPTPRPQEKWKPKNQVVTLKPLSYGKFHTFHIIHSIFTSRILHPENSFSLTPPQLNSFHPNVVVLLLFVVFLKIIPLLQFIIRFFCTIPAEGTDFLRIMEIIETASMKSEDPKFWQLLLQDRDAIAKESALLKRNNSLIPTKITKLLTRIYRNFRIKSRLTLLASRFPNPGFIRTNFTAIDKCIYIHWKYNFRKF